MWFFSRRTPAKVGSNLNCLEFSASADTCELWSYLMLSKWAPFYGGYVMGHEMLFPKLSREVNKKSKAE